MRNHAIACRESLDLLKRYTSQLREDVLTKRPLYSLTVEAAALNVTQLGLNDMTLT